SRLRCKLEDVNGVKLIRTVHKAGYIMDVPSENQKKEPANS
ncbi:MAG: helix-turn-helix domain-containing protein, partial [Chloroflexi bacterium]|nr:helix-turn-helix domain-containing protein [Chloroflexota bacterium]